MDNTQTLSRSSWHFLSGTMLSRVTGMFRDMLTAFCFGTEPAIAAFLVAFRLANLMRRIFGEGALTVSFIPHYETMHKESAARATAYFRDLLVSTTVVLLVVIALLEGGLWTLSICGEMSADNQQIIHLTALMLPGLLFICLFALCTAVLQCDQVYFLTGLAPAIFNFVWMAAVWGFRERDPVQAAQWLAVAVTAAFCLQWLLVVPKTVQILSRSLALGDWLRARLFSPDLRALVGSLSLGVVGVGAMQINSALDVLFARFASLEGPAYLTYAIRLQQLPLALFAIAVSSAALPPLARAIAAEQREKFRSLLGFALSHTFSLIFPCTIGLFVLGAAAVNLVFGHGHFTAESTAETTLCLWGYGLGLIPASFVVVLASAFYARKDYWTPTKASLCAITVSVLLNSWLVFGLGWGAQSVAVATSAAALLNAWILAHKLSRESGPIWSANMLHSLFKTGSCALAAGAAALVAGSLLNDPSLALLLHHAPLSFSRSLYEQCLNFALPALAFASAFLLMAWWTSAHEILELFHLRKTARLAEKA